MNNQPLTCSIEAHKPSDVMFMIVAVVISTLLAAALFAAGLMLIVSLMN